MGEEFANSISHGIGLLGALIAAPILIVVASQHGDGTEIVSAGIFGSAMVLMYLSSTLYHSLPLNRAKQILKVLDHCAIFVLIAGTYTPFTLLVLDGTWGWPILGTI